MITHSAGGDSPAAIVGVGLVNTLLYVRTVELLAENIHALLDRVPGYITTTIIYNVKLSVYGGFKVELGAYVVVQNFL